MNKRLKRRLKRVMRIYGANGIKAITTVVVVAVCSFMISDELLNNSANKGFDTNEVIEISYSENISAKLAEANTGLELKPISEKELAISKAVPVVAAPEPKKEEKPATTVEQPAAVEPTPVVPEPSAPEIKTGDGVEIAKYATQFAGNPYVYGGTSLTNGADCSGFVMAVYASFGISIPRTATAQSYAGQSVSIDALQPGDLVFYGYGSIDHVAMYIGGGQVIHAMNPYQGIAVTSYSYGTPIVSAARYVKSN